MNHTPTLDTARVLKVIALLLAPWLGSLGWAGETRVGPLVIVGGGLLPNNSAVFERFIADAGGPQRAVIGIFPTAGTSTLGGERFKRLLVERGVPDEQVQVIDVSESNAAFTAESPAVVEQIGRCSALYFTGGVQSRIMRALTRADGTPTAALQEIRKVWARGGAVGGSSAGAAIQSDRMISVSGLPGNTLDEGMDALDFGLVKSIRQPARRGLLVTDGLGLFEGGLIDQHFSQYRGRLSRLARAAIEERIRFGFGIDENTALSVAPDGTIEVLGAGCLTVVDTAGATCQDGPLGCRMSGILISLLQQGDRFDPDTGKVTVHPSKKPIVAGRESNQGKVLVPDIAGANAVPSILIDGLADNVNREQVGIMIKYNQHYGHGYRFTFQETDQTRSFTREVDGASSYAVLQVRLEIEPVTVTLRPPETALPLDLPQGPARMALEAISFRGILLTDEQGRIRPQDAINRADLAAAMVQTIRLARPRIDLPKIVDLPAATRLADDIILAVTAGLMDLDSQGAFRPAEPIERPEAVNLFGRLAQRYRSEDVTLKRISKSEGHLTRAEAATAIYEIVGFPW